MEEIRQADRQAVQHDDETISSKLHSLTNFYSSYCCRSDMRML